MEAAGMGPAPLLAPQQSGLKVMLPGGGARNSPHYLLLGGAGPGGLDGSGGLSPNGGVPSSLEMSERSWEECGSRECAAGSSDVESRCEECGRGFPGTAGRVLFPFPEWRVILVLQVLQVLEVGNSSQGGNGFAHNRQAWANMLQTMPPRPRPEGGQEQWNVFESGNEIRKDDLIIGSWDEECKERGKPALSQQYHYQQTSFKSTAHEYPPSSLQSAIFNAA
ncbi:unnamed protein product [Lepeophtheirus salmonis]|uniref:(salmon louse) hypothetical protein n=1 Tax=Lepeophtheirus salmonis TaxID=72036 RepID=A0A7R8CH06_LEPSM|nr:unnamed protein product [Lepeophtheirus salmonis]CAF2820128.1 unnamed protein product [Lepeophtheirus salmonis]